MRQCENDAEQQDLIFIVGFGRSGTNWLLNLLDLSPRTHCRNEPNEIPGAPLKKIPSINANSDHIEELEAEWDSAVQWASTHIGERDRAPHVAKEHYYSLSRVFALNNFVFRPRLRALISAFYPSLRGREWPLPIWLGSRRRLEKSVPVIKLVATPEWASWVLVNRPHAHLLHIVRHPGGVLNSWRKRYLETHDPVVVANGNQTILSLIADSNPSWAKQFGDIEQMSAEESVLWYWRYAVETIHAAGIDKPNYTLVNYENLVANPVDVTRSIYDVCRLPWNESVKNKVQGKGSSTKKKNDPWYDKLDADKEVANAWRSNLSTGEEEIVSRILNGSMMENWWS